MLYFDHSATTKPSEEILDTYLRVSREYFANPSSAHQAGQICQQLLEQARTQVAQILSVKADEVYFTSSGTESNNWVLQVILDQAAKSHPDRHQVILSQVEHPSIFKQIPLLQSKGYQVKLAPVDESGCIDIDQLENLLSDDVLLLSTMAVNNEVGSVQDLKAISRLLEDYPQILWHVDGVQGVCLHLDRMKQERIDLLTLSGHKFHAPRGTGILVMKERVNRAPLLYGGGQERGLRSSTENLATIVSTAKALRFAEAKQTASYVFLKGEHDRIVEALESQNWTVFAKDSASPHIICAAYPGIPGEVLINAFSQEGAMVSTTSACSSRKHQAHHTLQAMGVDPSLAQSAIRLSMSQSTSAVEVDQLLAVIERISKRFSLDLQGR